MPAPRIFPLADVLSVTTPRLLSDRGMDGLTDLLNFMTGDELELCGSCSAPLTRRGPRSSHSTRSSPTSSPRGSWASSGCGWWRLSAVMKHGADLPVLPLPGWVHQDPVEEFVDRVELAQMETAPPAPGSGA